MREQREEREIWPAVLLTGLLLAAVMLLASGCASGGGTAGSGSSGYTLYYRNLEGTGLVTEEYDCTATDFSGIMNELLDRLKTPVNEKKEQSPIPSEVSINSKTIGIGEVVIDFSRGYLSLDSTTELLLRASIVMTLSQMNGVDYVRITEENNAIKDPVTGEAIGQMDRSMFIVPEGSTINPYRNMEVPLYFSNQTGDGLVLEKRRLLYSSNFTKEWVIAQQIIEGPSNDTLLPVTASGVIVRGVSVKDNVCRVDFSGEFNSAPSPDSPVKAETTLYAFVNSIIDAGSGEGIDTVRFTIEGSSEVKGSGNGRFRGQVLLDQDVHRNADIIDTASASQVEAGVVVDGEDSAAAVTDGTEQG